ncbi:MAG: DUF5777 family beta-barrel protein [Algoriphagus sp.]|uniref:DUF5777 family beta-barrel protein n=1 Tax=Algoriphagus sp. TaxID=1872435 RepID=UPI002633244C|nr:DUF5777 family beta-barrel protein [Algoriphagus sp.]MDG1277241.1 DUF5777 family beta-barrel protein [Algoriphagus sp.]
MRIKIISLLVFILFFGLIGRAFAQDDLMAMLDEDLSKEPVYTYATFKATRLINGQTVETISKKHLNFWISHRFGAVNSGFINNFFGLDEAKIRLGLEYGITDQWLIGAGRSSMEKTYDFYSKYKVLRQSNKIPVTVTAMGGWAINTMNTGYITETGAEMKFFNNLERYSYHGQLLIARKFNEKLSLQLMPTVLHQNRVESASIENTMLSMGGGGRYKLSNRITLSAEYYYNLVDKNQYQSETGLPYPFHNSLSLGVDIETGGHVFQLHFTNSKGMIEKQFIGQTIGTWENKDIFYGFNIARTFSLDKSAKKKIK